MKKLVFYLNLKSEKPKFKYPYLLLHPTIPWPLGGVNPRTIEGKEWWDKTRKEAMRENNNCCWACGIHRLDTPEQWLEGHERYCVDHKAHTSQYLGTVALCHACHAFIHRGRRRGWKRTPTEIAIDERGLQLLKEAGLAVCLPLPPPPIFTLDWVLLYKGKKYGARCKEVK